MKIKHTSIDPINLVVNKEVNFREDYDLPSLEEEIRRDGRINDPIHYRKEDKMVLKGNRRTLVAQSILTDPKCPADLKAALSKVSAVEYEGLTDEEAINLMLDHGSAKSLNRSEIVKACWRLQQKMYGFREIAIKMLQLLAEFTGNKSKYQEVMTLPLGAGRTEAIGKWLKGTLDDYILKAGKMGSFIQEQVLLTERSKDKRLSDDDKKKVVFESKRDRIGKLWTAIQADRTDGTWDDVKETGPKFQELVAKFAAEDAGTAPVISRKMTAKQIEEAPTTFKSAALKTAFKKVNGSLEEGAKDLDAWDADLFRQDKVMTILRESFNKDWKSDCLEVKELIKNILYKDEAAVQTALQVFLK